MTVFEYAVIKFAAGLMTPDERRRAKVLAEKTEAGDRNAEQAFKDLTSYVLADAANRQRKNAGRKEQGT